jgi:hypothetical protein
MSFPIEAPIARAIINKDKSKHVFSIERLIVVKVKVNNITSQY